MDDFTRLVDLASARLGGVVLWANDDFFAAKENLVEPRAPTFDPDAYTDRGKQMDGWESRRRRTPGHDSCVLRLGLPGVVRGVVVDTAFFRGNYPEECSLEGCAAAADASVEELRDDATEWVELLPRSPLAGDSRNRFAITAPYRFTHLRFHIYPDGGVARLRVHGEVMPDWPAVVATGGEIDLVAAEHGGRWLAASDMFFSSPQNLLMPGRGVRMDDGWETRRRRGPGFDWCVLQLGVAGSVRRIEVDTAHFKGNYPDTCTLEGCVAPGGERAAAAAPVAGAPSGHASGAGAGNEGADAVAGPGDEDGSRVDFDAWPWRELLPRTKLQADSRHELAPTAEEPVTHVRFSIHPDGGVSRLRLFGDASREGLATAAVARLDAMLPRQATAAFTACCGAPEWVRQMAARRPYTTVPALLAAADAVWAGLDEEQWLTAFRAHPEIGAREPAVSAGEAAAAWSAQEQSSVRDADAATRDALAAANLTYRERFGHIFIVCATGKSTGEMLAACWERLGNDPERELQVAAEEQRRITRLRLLKLLSDLAGAPVEEVP